MTIQTLTLSQIQPCAMNPRKFFNDTTIEELAQSIKTDGLLQNLVVLNRPESQRLVAGSHELPRHRPRPQRAGSGRHGRGFRG